METNRRQDRASSDAPTAESHPVDLDAPTSRSGAESDTDLRTDEIVGLELERYLESLRAGSAPQIVEAADSEIAQLKHSLRRLHELSMLLAAPADPKVSRAAKTPPPERQEVKRLGKYEVLRILGQGGQANALLAFDPDLRRHVVIKLYARARTNDEQDVVLSEGRALARVASPYVAKCYGAERHDGNPFLVMEYVRGKNLAELHASQPLGIPAALDLIAKVTEGLTAVHACGLLHRDVKPSNIIVGEDGIPRLVDFGLAAPLGSEVLLRISGTLPYMAPEQARGEIERIDPRTDIFGLGAVLYFLLTGRPLYEAEGRERLLALARAGDIAPPRAQNPRLDSAVNELCMRCLAKEPSQRFESATALRDAIRRIQGRGRMSFDLGLRLGNWQIRILIGTAAALLLIAPLLFVQLGDNAAQTFPPLAHDALPFNVPPAPGPVDEGEPLVQQVRHPDGRPLRREFALRVELIGGQLTGSGAVRLTEGDEIAIRLEAELDCYVAVWSVEPDTVVQLFPNEAETNHGLRAGQPRIIPGEPDVPDYERKVIRVTPSKGGEYIHAVASTRPLTAADGERFGPYVVITKPEDRTRWQERLRGLTLETAPSGSVAPFHVSEVIIPYEVEVRDRPSKTQRKTQ